MQTIRYLTTIRTHNSALIRFPQPKKKLHTHQKNLLNFKLSVNQIFFHKPLEFRRQLSTSRSKYDEEDEEDEDEEGEFKLVDRLSQGLVLQAIDLFSRGNFEKCLSNCEQALKNNPTDTFAMYYKGLSLDSLKRYDEALIVFEQLTTLDPQDPVPLFYKAMVQNSTGKHQEALETLSQVSQLDPDEENHCEIHTERAIAFLHLSRNKEALMSVERALVIDPNNTRAAEVKTKVLSANKR